ncbi:MAG: phage terminase large subunit [Treponema sp.]|jgi:predicted phage terminase large subunit-like protein|nr:phage terminase large subunit [Treponema sp.]
MPKTKTTISDNELYAMMYLQRLNAIDHHLNFMSYTWTDQTTPFTVGIHTRKICACIDKAVEKFRQGISTYLIITVPVRHGKSEIVSRQLPAHFLGLFPDCKVILCGHTERLTEDFSKISRNLIYTPQYQDLFSGINTDPGSSSGSHWKIKDCEGECFAAGLLGSLSGQGYHLGVLDDYCRNRADAESETMREKMWSAFTDDFMTRRAPVSITIVLATRWHIDDIIGRIIEKMKDEPAFPCFEVINIPAFSDKYLTGTLFPERYSLDWYETQKSTLGNYGTASLLQNDPIIRGGNLLKTDMVQVHRDINEFPLTTYTRVWDYAHTEKQRMKSDPDFTSGTLLAYTKINEQWHLWVKDVARYQLAAPERDAKILNIVERDGEYARIAAENTIDAKDAVAQMRKLLRGKRTVQDASGKGDKVVRATPLEAIFEAGNVHILQGAWNQEWVKEIGQFPSGKHDDQVDNLSAGYFLYSKGIGLSDETRQAMAERRQSRRGRE